MDAGSFNRGAPSSRRTPATSEEAAFVIPPMQAHRQVGRMREAKTDVAAIRRCDHAGSLKVPEWLHGQFRNPHGMGHATHSHL